MFFLTIPVFAQDANSPDGNSVPNDYYYSPDLYPNLFLPEQYRNGDVPDEVVQEQKLKIELAVESILKRFVFAIADKNTKSINDVFYFDYLLSEVKKIDPNAKIIPSGGVVRSVLSYIYDEMRKGKTLESFLKDTNEIRALEIRGIGSDFDIFALSSNGKFRQIQSRVEEITNSAKETFNLQATQGLDRRAFLTMADTKDFISEHLERSVPQGGSVLDFLGYDYEAGKFMMPEQFPSIVDDFIRGVYEYIEPITKDAENFHKQIIRGFRALVEIPFLRIKNEAQLRKELEIAIKEVNEGKFPNDENGKKALEQFSKMLRNSRDYGAKNRMWRGQKGSIEELFLKYVKAIRVKVNSGVNPFPEFVQYKDIDTRKIEHLPKSFLISVQDFNSKYTNNGKFYHGTPSIDDALAIIRGGLFESYSENGGAGAYGKAAYSSKDYGVSEGYARGKGIVFELKLKENQNINILDFEKYQNSSHYEKTLAEAQSIKMDHFDYLMWNCGVDIIINHHILIKNSAALDLKNGLVELVKGLTINLENKSVDVYAKAYNFLQLSKILAYGIQSKEFGKIKDQVDLTRYTKIKQNILNELFTKLSNKENRYGSRFSTYQLAKEINSQTILFESDKNFEVNEKKLTDLLGNLVHEIKTNLNEKNTDIKNRWETVNSLAKIFEQLEGTGDSEIFKDILDVKDDLNNYLQKEYVKAFDKTSDALTDKSIDINERFEIYDKMRFAFMFDIPREWNISKIFNINKFNKNLSKFTNEVKEHLTNGKEVNYQNYSQKLEVLKKISQDFFSSYGFTAPKIDTADLETKKIEQYIADDNYQYISNSLLDKTKKYDFQALYENSESYSDFAKSKLAYLTLVHNSLFELKNEKYYSKFLEYTSRAIQLREFHDQIIYIIFNDIVWKPKEYLENIKLFSLSPGFESHFFSLLDVLVNGLTGRRGENVAEINSVFQDVLNYLDEVVDLDVNKEFYPDEASKNTLKKNVLEKLASYIVVGDKATLFWKDSFGWKANNLNELKIFVALKEKNWKLAKQLIESNKIKKYCIDYAIEQVSQKENQIGNSESISELSALEKTLNEKTHVSALNQLSSNSNLSEAISETPPVVESQSQLPKDFGKNIAETIQNADWDAFEKVWNSAESDHKFNPYLTDQTTTDNNGTRLWELVGDKMVSVLLDNSTQYPISRLMGPLQTQLGPIMQTEKNAIKNGEANLDQIKAYDAISKMIVSMMPTTIARKLLNLQVSAVYPEGTFYDAVSEGDIETIKKMEKFMDSEQIGRALGNPHAVNYPKIIEILINRPNIPEKYLKFAADNLKIDRANKPSDQLQEEIKNQISVVLNQKSKTQNSSTIEGNTAAHQIPSNIDIDYVTFKDVSLKDLKYYQQFLNECHIDKKTEQELNEYLKQRPELAESVFHYLGMKRQFFSENLIYKAYLDILRSLYGSDRENTDVVDLQKHFTMIAPFVDPYMDSANRNQYEIVEERSKNMDKLDENIEKYFMDILGFEKLPPSIDAKVLGIEDRSITNRDVLDIVYGEKVVDQIIQRHKYYLIDESVLPKHVKFASYDLPALMHPNISHLLGQIKARGSRLVVDPYYLNSYRGNFSPVYAHNNIVFISLSAAYHVVEHEYTHLVFDDAVEHARKILSKQNGSFHETLQLLIRDNAISRESNALNGDIQAYDHFKKQYPDEFKLLIRARELYEQGLGNLHEMEDINETLATEAQIRIFDEVGLPRDHIDRTIVREYALSFQIKGLNQLKAANKISESQLALLDQIQNEREVLKYKILAAGEIPNNRIDYANKGDFEKMIKRHNTEQKDHPELQIHNENDYERLRPQFGYSSIADAEKYSGPINWEKVSESSTPGTKPGVLSFLGLGELSDRLSSNKPGLLNQAYDWARGKVFGKSAAEAESAKVVQMNESNEVSKVATANGTVSGSSESNLKVIPGGQYSENVSGKEVTPMIPMTKNQTKISSNSWSMIESVGTNAAMELRNGVVESFPKFFVAGMLSKIVTKIMDKNMSLDAIIEMIRELPKEFEQNAKFAAGMTVGTVVYDVVTPILTNRAQEEFANEASGLAMSHIKDEYLMDILKRESSLSKGLARGQVGMLSATIITMAMDPATKYLSHREFMEQVFKTQVTFLVSQAAVRGVLLRGMIAGASVSRNIELVTQGIKATKARNFWIGTVAMGLELIFQDRLLKWVNEIENNWKSKSTLADQFLAFRSKPTQANYVMLMQSSQRYWQSILMEKLQGVREEHEKLQIQYDQRVRGLEFITTLDGRKMYPVIPDSLIYQAADYVQAKTNGKEPPPMKAEKGIYGWFNEWVFRHYHDEYQEQKEVIFNQIDPNLMKMAKEYRQGQMNVVEKAREAKVCVAKLDLEHLIDKKEYQKRAEVCEKPLYEATNGLDRAQRGILNYRSVGINAMDANFSVLDGLANQAMFELTQTWTISDWVQFMMRVATQMSPNPFQLSGSTLQSIEDVVELLEGKNDDILMTPEKYRIENAQLVVGNVKSKTEEMGYHPTTEEEAANLGLFTLVMPSGKSEKDIEFQIKDTVQRMTYLQKCVKARGNESGSLPPRYIKLLQSNGKNVEGHNKNYSTQVSNIPQSVWDKIKSWSGTQAYKSKGFLGMMQIVQAIELDPKSKYTSNQYPTRFGSEYTKYKYSFPIHQTQLDMISPYFTTCDPTFPSSTQGQSKPFDYIKAQPTPSFQDQLKNQQNLFTPWLNNQPQ